MILFRLTSLLTVLACCSALLAKDIETVVTMHDTIPVYGTQADVQLATFAGNQTEETVVIAEGKTVALVGEQSALDVLVRGTLQLRRGSHLKCRTLTVLGSGARLEMHRNCTLTIRDLPIDRKIDPSQYGHGLLVIHGSLLIESDDWRQTWQQLAKEIKTGDKEIELVGEARGWRAGDRLVLPDTRQPAEGAELSAQTEIVTVASAYVGKITLTAPVQFDHRGWRGSDGAVQLLPDVGCLTQPIVIRSENPKGTRGHVFITAGAHQDVHGVALVEMGRTTTAPLAAGTNQIGRYAWHHHHLLGRVSNGLPWQFRLEHVSIEGSPKWGIAVHGSHFGIVNDGFAYNCAGCGIVTEDPWVYGNKITNNMVVAKQRGSGLRITKDHGGRAGRNEASGDHWHNMGGLGLESAMNEITGNRTYCCTESYGMAGFGTSVLHYPKAPGICAECLATNRVVLGSHLGYVPGEPRRYPFLFETSGNRAWSGWRGIELWSADTYLDYEHGFDGLTLVNCRYPTDLEDQQETVMRGWKILGDWTQAVPPTGNGDKTVLGLDFKPGYRFGITFMDGEIRGCGAAYNLTNDVEYTRFQRTTFECPVINYMPLGRVARSVTGEWTGEWTECTFVGNPLFADGQYPKYDLSIWLGNNDRSYVALVPIRTYIRPWHDGRDYQVFHPEQHPAWQHSYGPPSAGAAYADWPIGVWTQQQLIDAGKPIFGDAVPPDAVPWGKFWASDLTVPDTQSCAEQLEKLLQENARLQQQLEQLQAPK